VTTEVAVYAPPPVEPPTPARPRRRLRLTDVTSVRRIRNETEWEGVKQKLDERVRALLRDFEVEIE
jgi:hypothetical protein